MYIHPEVQQTRAWCSGRAVSVQRLPHDATVPPLRRFFQNVIDLA